MRYFDQRTQLRRNWGRRRSSAWSTTASGQI